MINIYHIILTVIILFSAAELQAKTFQNEDLKLDVNGYVGYRYIGSTAKNSVLPSNPELGLALSLQTSQYLSFYTQFAYANEIDNALLYSFASIDVPLNDEITAGIKIGKLRHDTGLFNATRVNPGTRPGVIVPQAIYWDSLQRMVTSGTGINLNIKWRNFEASYSIDKPDVADAKSEAFTWTRNLLKEIETSFGSHQTAFIKYSDDSIPLTLKSTWKRVNLGNNNNLPVFNFIFKNKFPESTNQIYDIFINSLQYSYENLTVSLEDIRVGAFFNSVSSIDQWSYGDSITLKYDVDDNISVYTNYNNYNSGHIANTPQLPWYYENVHDGSVGINYHKDNWMIGVEAHKIQGGRWVEPQDFNADPNAYKNWYMIAVNAVYFF